MYFIHIATIKLIRNERAYNQVNCSISLSRNPVKVSLKANRFIASEFS